MFRPTLRPLPLLLCWSLCLLLWAKGTAGEFNPVLSPGDAAPAWKDLPGVDGQAHSLADLSEKPVVVLAFTCNSCPYAVDHEDRLIALAKKYATGDAAKVAVVAINVNKVEEDLLPAMKEKAAAKGFNFPYLFDETQQIAKDYGAGYTPEFFVLDKDRRVVYLGSLDDSPMGDNITKPYVEDAIAATLAGKAPTVKETVPIGCRMRMERVRRGR